ncbi:hypothetical protein GCM10022296_18630 [Secundilactobacillus similis DSM 23365 = JCM 2765]|jgi:hypothetical protein
MVFISFIAVLFVIAGAWELYQSHTRRLAQSKHFATTRRSYVQAFFRLIHLS